MAQESDLYLQFSKKFILYDPLVFIYKIPDTIGLGGKRPFDTFGVTKGYPFCVEFKSPGKEPTLFQKYKLFKFKTAKGGAFSFIRGKETLDDLIKRILIERKKQCGY